MLTCCQEDLKFPLKSVNVSQNKMTDLGGTKDEDKTSCRMVVMVASRDRAGALQGDFQTGKMALTMRN